MSRSGEAGSLPGLRPRGTSPHSLPEPQPGRAPEHAVPDDSGTPWDQSGDLSGSMASMSAFWNSTRKGASSKGKQKQTASRRVRSELEKYAPQNPDTQEKYPRRSLSFPGSSRTDLVRYDNENNARRMRYGDARWGWLSRRKSTRPPFHRSTTSGDSGGKKATGKERGGSSVVPGRKGSPRIPKKSSQSSKAGSRVFAKAKRIFSLPARSNRTRDSHIEHDRARTAAIQDVQSGESENNANNEESKPTTQESASTPTVEKVNKRKEAFLSERDKLKETNVQMRNKCAELQQRVDAAKALRSGYDAEIDELATACRAGLADQSVEVSLEASRRNFQEVEISELKLIGVVDQDTLQSGARRNNLQAHLER